MRICLIGPPGAGKTTISRILSNLFLIPYVSTGEVLRNMMGQGTPLSKELKSLFNKGELAPPDIVIQVMTEELKSSKYVDGYILDGSPRTQFEAFQLFHNLKSDIPSKSLEPDYIYLLEITKAAAQDRLMGRGRFDDTVESIGRRFDIFEENITGIIHELVLHYPVKTINGSRNRMRVLSQILHFNFK